MNAVEYRLYQGIVDALDVRWIPEIYYTLAYGSKVPCHRVSKDMLAAMEPFVGEVNSTILERCMQTKIDEILHGYTMRREILIWTNANVIPGVIDTARVVRTSEYDYRIAPILDRTDIMREVMEKLELTGQD